jgi:hypothetical protein
MMKEICTTIKECARNDIGQQPKADGKGQSHAEYYGKAER